MEKRLSRLLPLSVFQLHFNGRRRTLPKIFYKTCDAADEILVRLGKDIRLATPVALGKPNELLNELYKRVKNNSELQLKIFTALSLNPLQPVSDLARRFFEPFAKIHWGDRYPSLEYAKDAAKGSLPKNIKVHEFYFQPGTALESPGLQRDYQSINYTQVAEAAFQRDVNIIVQLIARKSSSGTTKYSLSCNPDVTLDLRDLYRKHNKPLLIVGVLHPELPFMGGDCEVEEEFFDLLVDDSDSYHLLFGLPRLPISDVDHAIGFYASQLVADNGTLQIGIGSLSDAIVTSIILRHTQSLIYSRLFEISWEGHQQPPTLQLEKKPFTHGIYGLSELVTDGYMHLRKAGILRREVIDDKSGIKTYLHGAFFLGSKEFYSWLRSLEASELSGIRMTRVSKVNDLYDAHELVLRQQRNNPRFFNTCMQVSLLGGAASDTLDDGRVVSGVGGQYNFVAMAQELQDSRSILMLRSTRQHNGHRYSNIVWSAGHLTIPRHLRDIVITEYGIADLRGKTDEETICALLAIADSEFQEELACVAKRNGKIAKGYVIPDWAKHNTPEKTRCFITLGKKEGYFKSFALGSDFSIEEEKLIVALERLQSLSSTSKISAAIRGLFLDSTPFMQELKRMNLSSPRSLIDWLGRSILISALRETVDNIS